MNSLSPAPYLLVLGSRSDGQLASVLTQLDLEEIPYRIIDHRTSNNARFEVGAGGNLLLQIDGELLGEPTLVWYRSKLRTVLGHWSEETIPEFVQRSEWNGFLSMIAAHFNDRNIHPGGLFSIAEIKSQQMAFASEVGFDIPPSSFFVGSDNARDFVSQHPRTVAKVISTPQAPQLQGDVDKYRRFMTMDVDRQNIDECDGAAFTSAPAFFQSRICKGIEHRVIAFRDRAFSYAIHPPVETRDRPDERLLYGAEVDGQKLYGAQYRPIETSSLIEKRTSAYLSRAGLAYAAFDIIVDGDQQIFIECNPEGQWYASSGLNEDEVAAHFANYLREQLQNRRSSMAAE